MKKENKNQQPLKESKDWEERFEREFINKNCSDNNWNWETHRHHPFAIMDFIRHLLAQKEQEQREKMLKHIDLFTKHCEDKKAQHKCSACVVLGDLKLKLLEDQSPLNK